MKKQFITEAQRMQQLAGIELNEWKVTHSGYPPYNLFDLIVSNHEKLVNHFNLSTNSSVSGNDDDEPVILSDNENEISFVREQDWEENKQFFNNNQEIGIININGIKVIYVIN